MFTNLQKNHPAATKLYTNKIRGSLLWYTITWGDSLLSSLNPHFSYNFIAFSLVLYTCTYKYLHPKIKLLETTLAALNANAKEDGMDIKDYL